MDDALDTALPLGFDGDDKSLATDGDEVLLGGAAVGVAAESGAEALFDGALLAFHFAANAAQVAGGVVGEGAVGKDFVVEGIRKRAEAGGEQRLGERGELRDAGWVGGCGRSVDEVGPRGDFVGKADEGEDFRRFEGHAVDAGSGKKVGGVKEGAGDGDGSRRREEAHLSDECVLAGDPGAVLGGNEGGDPGAAKGGLSIGAEEGDKFVPLERRAGRNGIGDVRQEGHVGIICCPAARRHPRLPWERWLHGLLAVAVGKQRSGLHGDDGGLWRRISERRFGGSRWDGNGEGDRCDGELQSGDGGPRWDFAMRSERDGNGIV